MDDELTRSQQHTFVAKQADSNLGCIRKSIAIKSREVLIPLFSKETHRQTGASTVKAP